MTQHSEATVRFERLWETAKETPTDGAPEIEGSIQSAIAAPDFTGQVSMIADRLLNEGLVDQSAHDRMYAGARDIDAVLSSVPADRLSDILGSPTSPKGGS